MAEHPVMTCERRSIIGKQVKRLRRQGRTPGVISGPVVPKPVPVAFETREFERIYHQAGTARLVDLVVDGKTYPVFIREVTVHPVSREILNVEFYAPDLARPVTVTVPVVTVGTLSPDVAGVVTIQLPELSVRALPTAVPEHIEVDLGLLSPERTAIQAGEIPLPPGVELDEDPEVVVVVVEEAEEAEVTEEAAHTLAEEVGDRPRAAEEGAKPVRERELRES
ncbi:MAG: 50S ribosomal protein L25 [Thermomicrobium sp.]|nr:50S ribosomal protein L25 [Thermomicrobium sp.]